MRNKILDIVGSIFVALIFTGFVYMILTLERRDKEYRLKIENSENHQDSVTSKLAVEYLNKAPDTITVKGDSFFIATYNRAIPVLINAITYKEYTYNVQSFKVLK